VRPTAAHGVITPGADADSFEGGLAGRANASCESKACRSTRPHTYDAALELERQGVAASRVWKVSKMNGAGPPGAFRAIKRH
jgi:hypothetical protein